MHMKIVIGGIIPREDYDFLTSNGAAVIFGPGTRIPAAAIEIVNIIRADTAL